MKLKNKYLKCFDEVKKNQLIECGYKYLYTSNGVFYFEENQDLTIKFSKSNILQNTKFSSWIGL
jgi:hypothetical protein